MLLGRAARQLHRGAGAAGAIDVAADIMGRRVYVAARDDDAVAAFDATLEGLSQPAGKRGCAALALAGCTLTPALDEPVAIGADWANIHVVARRSQAVLDARLGSPLRRAPPPRDLPAVGA